MGCSTGAPQTPFKNYVAHVMRNNTPCPPRPLIQGSAQRVNDEVGNNTLIHLRRRYSQMQGLPESFDPVPRRGTSQEQEGLIAPTYAARCRRNRVLAAVSGIHPTVGGQN